MQQLSFPVFEIIEIENKPYLRLQFDKHQHLAWLSQHMICSEVSDNSSSHDYPTDLRVDIPLIAFVEAYMALEQYKNISQVVISCSVSSDEFAQQECSFYHNRVIINKPNLFDNSETPGSFAPSFYFSLAFADWFSDREWIVELNLAMLGLVGNFVDDIGSVDALKRGLAEKSYQQTQQMYPIFDWF